MDVIFGILGILLLIAVASITVTVAVVWAVARRVRRSKAVNASVLRSRATFTTGPRRKVYALRLRLREALESGRAAVDLAVRNGGRRSELPRLYRRVEEEGLALDTQLRLMESEHEKTVLADQLALASLRVDEISGMVHRVRDAVAIGLAHPGSDSIASLRLDLEREVMALQAGLVELRDLSAPSRYGAPDRRPPVDRLHAEGAPS